MTNDEERRSAIDPPRTDPTPIFEHFRGSYGTELLTAAVAQFNVFGRLAPGPRPWDELRGELGLATRPMNVLVTALRAMGLLKMDDQGRLALSDLAREHLVPGSPFDVGNYIGLAAEGPGVKEMIERLRTNRPRGETAEESGAAFIYREGMKSAMEQEAEARRLTLSLAGRAMNVAPVLAGRVPLDGCRLLLDVGGGSGIYSIAYLQKYPRLRAIVWDRPEVLKVAEEMAATHGVADRLRCEPGDMFADPVPAGSDVMLVSNVLHDWDEPECRMLVSRLAAPLPRGGRLLIHDVFLDDDLGGPLPIALYSAALFTLTHGRAYSAVEYRTWLADAGLQAGEITPTLIHCGVLPGARQQ